MWEKNFTMWVGSRASVVVHTIFFAVMFSLPYFGIDWQTVLLVLTTVVSLEAIYLAIFIQMTVNDNNQTIREVEGDIQEISGDIDEIQHDVDEIQQDVDEIQHDVDEIQEDVEEIQEDVDEIEKDAEENEVDEALENEKLNNIEMVLRKLLDEVENLKKK